MRSPWQRLLVSSSLAAVLIWPLAYVHNCPWLRIQGRTETLEGIAWSVAVRMLPLEVCIAAAFAMWGLLLTSEAQPRGAGRRLLLWLSCVAGAWVPLLSLMPILESGLMDTVPAVGSVVGVIVLCGAPVSYGVFALSGLPCTVLVAHRKPGIAAHWLWVVLAAMVGGAAIFWASYLSGVFDNVGLGFWGPAELWVAGGHLGAWGAGIGGLLAQRRMGIR